MSKYVVPKIQHLYVFTKGDVWAIMKDLANHKAWDIQGFKPKFLKWASKDLCKPITRLSNYQPQTPTLMCRSPGESQWLTCTRLTPIAFKFQSQYSKTRMFNHTTFIQDTSGCKYWKILPSLVSSPTQLHHNCETHSQSFNSLIMTHLLTQGNPPKH